MAKDLVIYKSQITNKKRTYNKKNVAKGNIFAKASKKRTQKPIMNLV